MRRLFVYGLVSLMVLGLIHQSKVLADHCCGGQDKKSQSSEEKAKPAAQTLAPEKAMCYVMGNEVETAKTKLKEEYKGITFYLCCDGCVPEFKKSPETYFKKMSADYPRFVSAIFEDYFTIRASLAGDSVKGIQEQASAIVANSEILAKLEPELKEVKVETLQEIADEISKSAQLLTQVKYTCPMHPEVKSDEPGNCPKCKMALSKQEPDIKAVRASFENLSNALISYLKEVDRKEGEPSITACTFYCPMAKKLWLQADKEVGNPYYGKSMLKCGELQE